MLKEEKTGKTLLEDATETAMQAKPLHLIAWSAEKSNQIDVADIDTKENYATFEGAQLRTKSNFYTPVMFLPLIKIITTGRI